MQGNAKYLIGIKPEEPKQAQGMKEFDKRRGRRKPTWLQHKFKKHKRFASAFDEFGIIWLIITSALVAYAATELSILDGVPAHVPLLLGLVYAPYFAYQAAKWSETSAQKAARRDR